MQILQNDITIVFGSESLNNVLYFTGKEWEQETGTYYFGARRYNPTIGQWLGRDPARQFESPYVFMGNGTNPLISFDPNGLYTETDEDGYVMDYIHNDDPSVWMNDDANERCTYLGDYLSERPLEPFEDDESDYSNNRFVSLNPDAFEAVLQNTYDRLNATSYAERFSPEFQENFDTKYFKPNTPTFYLSEGIFYRGDEINYIGIGMLHQSLNIPHILSLGTMLYWKNKHYNIGYTNNQYHLNNINHFMIRGRNYYNGK